MAVTTPVARQFGVRLDLSPAMRCGVFQGEQTESISHDEIDTLFGG